MKKIRVDLQNMTPLLMNPMTPETLEAMRTKTSAPPRTDVPVDTIAGERLYRNEEGLVGLPALNVYAAMIEAGRNFKVNFGGGKPRQISTGSSSMLPALVLVEDEFLPFPEEFQADDAWKTDSRRGRLKDGTAVCVVRPRFDKWAFSMTLAVKNKKITEAMARALVLAAGDYVGVGDFRPSCKGIYGRFGIKNWEVVEEYEDETEKLEAA